MVTESALQSLKQYGFMWIRDQSTDKVGENYIADVVPTADGFTVFYNEKSALRSSTAVVEKIELSETPDKTWHRVYWKSIKDERR